MPLLIVSKHDPVRLEEEVELNKLRVPENNAHQTGGYHRPEVQEGEV